MDYYYAARLYNWREVFRSTYDVNDIHLSYHILYMASNISLNFLYITL